MNSTVKIPKWGYKVPKGGQMPLPPPLNEALPRAQYSRYMYMYAHFKGGIDLAMFIVFSRFGTGYKKRLGSGNYMLVLYC